MKSEGAELSGELEPEPPEGSRAICSLSLESVDSNEDFESGCRGGTMKPEGSATWSLSEVGWSISIADLDSVSDSESSVNSEDSDVSFSSALGDFFENVLGTLNRLSGGEAAERALELGTFEKEIVGYVFVLKRLFCEDRHDEKISSSSLSSPVIILEVLRRAFFLVDPARL